MTFGAKLLRWYARHGRDLPWRRTRDHYAILVSEVMLQQTQVARVLPAYARFLARFPTLGALAQAPLADVLRAWSGLGYNRRARDLHRIARVRGRGLPRDVAELDALPGIGRYTAAAVACFAHGARVPFADTNIRRVLGRAFLGRVATEAEARQLDAALLARDRAAAWHHALMDLGALVCTGRAPRCPECPVRADCLSRGRATPPDPAPASPSWRAASSGGSRDGGRPRGSPGARRRQAPYASSDRRLRGRIVARLAAAAGPVSLVVLRRELRDGRLPRLVRALAAEGLVERRGALLRLPE